MITINHDQKLYVMPCGGGYSYIGVDYAEVQRLAVLNWLHLPVDAIELGTTEHYDAYTTAMKQGREHHRLTGERCEAALIPSLKGLEGSRVELTYPSGEKTRFIVGRSTGWLPIHLEIKTKRSRGGSEVYFPDRTTVRVVNQR